MLYDKKLLYTNIDASKFKKCTEGYFSCHFAATRSIKEEGIITVPLPDFVVKKVAFFHLDRPKSAT